MGTIQFGLKIFLFHLLLLLCAHGASGRAMTSAENGRVSKLPCVDNEVTEHRDHHMMDHIDPSMMVFFTIDDLKIGNKIPIYFPIQDSSSSSTSPPLLSKEETNSIPFSHEHLSYLLRLFSFSPQSPQAQAMEHTLKECETEPIKGEIKACPTSLESMHDFVQEIFGFRTKFQVLRTTHLIKSSRSLDNYTILGEPKEIKVPSMVACHTMPYPYAVFYCHSPKSENKVFLLSLGGDNGGRVEAVAVCHMDTSDWERNHASFIVLKTEPGYSPVCHFFKEDALVYVPLYAY